MLKTAVLTLLALQTCLDRRGFSSNILDGQDGPRTQAALVAYCASRGLPPPAENASAGDLLRRLFPDEGEIFSEYVITTNELKALVRIPSTPAGKAALSHMGYESAVELLAERAHTSPKIVALLNPDLDLAQLKPGTAVMLPDVSPAADNRKAALVRVSLSAFTVSAVDAAGKLLAVFPCSIARDKAKLPPPGIIRITSCIENPNYTYTPERQTRKRRMSRQIFPAGPNNPVGTIWLGLSLPGYGIHGTPSPRTIGCAESHGCFRLANWNAEKLYRLVRPGTRVLIEK